MPAVSILTPAYLAADFLGRAAASARRQTFDDWEMLIVADDMIDYADMLARNGLDDPRVRHLTTGGVALGPGRARNIGLDEARGEVVVTLDADDELAPSYLEVVAPVAREKGVCYTDNRYVDHATGADLPDRNAPHEAGPVGLHALLTSKLQTFANVCFRPDRVPARWLEAVTRWEDLTFFVTCYDYVESIHHVRAPLYTYYRRHGSLCNVDEAAAKFIDSLKVIEGMLLDGRLPLRNPESHALFLKYLHSRIRLEELYDEGLQAGAHGDYLEFVGRNVPLFRTLDLPKGY